MKDGSQVRSKSRARSRSRSSLGVTNKSDKQNDMASNVKMARVKTQKDSLNNFKTTFEQRLEENASYTDQGNDMNDGLSPRSILKRARDKTVRELSESFHVSKSKSPNRSGNLQRYVELESASPHQHTGKALPSPSRVQGTNLSLINDSQLKHAMQSN